MEGNFESGGMSSGSSMGGGQAGSGFDSSTEMSTPELAQSSTSLNSGGMTWEGYLKDGVDNGFYKVDTEGVFSVDEVMSEAQSEMEADEEVEWDFMDIPGTAHEKLSTFSDMSDEEINGEETAENFDNDLKKEDEIGSESSYGSEDFRSKSENDIKLKEELSFEQKIIQIQSETIKLLAESMNNKLNKKEVEELIKKLKEALKEADKEEGNKDNKAAVMNGVLGLINLILTMTEQGYKKLEHEVQEIEK